MSEDTPKVESSVLGSKVFDMTWGFLHKNPDATAGKPSTCLTTTPVREQAQTYIVQTIRHREDEKSGDYVFVQYLDAEGAMRIVLPPAVAEAIARQRDALTTKVRKQIAKRHAQQRKAQGIQPAFMKSKKKGRKKSSQAEGA